MTGDCFSAGLLAITGKLKGGRAINAAALNRLRPYQQAAAQAILESVFEGKGMTFSVEIAR